MINKIRKNIWKIFVIFLSLFTFGWTFFSIYKVATSLAPDFSVLWKTTVDTFTHKNPYLDKNLVFPHLLPPITSIFYIPVAILNYKMAQSVFLIVSLSATIFCVYISLKITFKKPSFYAFLIAASLTLLSFPTKFTLGMGQVNSISFLFLILSYFVYKKSKFPLSGVLLGISIISKPILGFFLVFFIIKKSWKVVTYTMLTLFIGFGISVLVNGLDIYFYWFKNILPTLLASQGKEVYYNQGLAGFISRLTTNFEVRKYLTAIISLPVVLYPIYLSFRTKNEDLQFSLFTITLLLIDSLSWQHHFVWLIFPFIVLSRYAAELKNKWVWVSLGIAYFLVSWNFKNPSLFSGFPKSLILSNTFYGAVIVYLLISYCLIQRRHKLA